MSDKTREDIIFNADIIKWNETNMVLYVNFTNPESISVGSFRDDFSISKIIDKNLFTSK